MTDLKRWVYNRITDALPTGKPEWRGLLAVLRDEPNPDTPYVALDDGSGTVDWVEVITADTLPPNTIIVQEQDVTIDGSVGTLDFDGDNFNLSSSPAGEVNIALNLGVGASNPAAGNHTHAASLIVQEGDSTVDSAVGTLDFDASDFNVTSSPAGEANIALAYGTGAGTPAEGNHTHTYTITVQEGDSNVDTAVTTLDFDASDFNVTSSPAGEANIALAYGTSAGTPAEGNHTHDPFIPFVRLFFDDTGGSTASTVTFTTVISGTFTLPAGTWTIEANAWGRLGHSAGGTCDIRMTIDGTAGTVYSRTGSTVANPGGAASSKSSVASGSRTVLCAVRANTAGTATMTNMHLMVNCYRTA